MLKEILLSCLGLFVDTKLVMRQAVEQMLAKIRPRIKALLRTRSHYNNESLVNQFKIQVWGLMEAHSGGIFHASTSILDQFDHSQKHFLDELGISVETAFLEFNFAPPTLRRNIAMLGLIHKRVLGECHPSFNHLMPWFQHQFGYQLEGRHTKQLYGHCNEVIVQQGLYLRSIFSMIDLYNALSQHAVEMFFAWVATCIGYRAACVDKKKSNHIQAYLTKVARTRCQDGVAKWMYTHDCRRRS